jgi:hypothetical protein
MTAGECVRGDRGGEGIYASRRDTMSAGVVDGSASEDTIRYARMIRPLKFERMLAPVMHRQRLKSDQLRCGFTFGRVAFAAASVALFALHPFRKI